MKITEFTKMVKHLIKLSSEINYHFEYNEFDNFEEWLYNKHNIELKEDCEQHIEELLKNETINQDEHIYLTIKESEKYIEILQDKINI